MALALLLDDALLADPDLAPVRAYLHAAGDKAETVDVRRVQLAARVGRLFEEYTYSRAEMLAGWRRGDDARRRATRRRSAGSGASGGRCSATEGSRRARIAADRAAPRGGRGARAGAHRAAAGGPRLRLRARRAHVPRAARAASGKLAEVVVYALTPCEGFWEDVDRRDPAPLHLWSAPGARARARAQRHRRFRPRRPLRRSAARTAPRTLLRQVQSDVLHREPQRAPRRAAPALRRRPERRRPRSTRASVASARPWRARSGRLVREDETLRFDDVAVLVPPGDAATYAAHLPAAFRQAHDVPHQIVGLPPAEPGRIEEAIELLLALPLGRFTRRRAPQAGRAPGGRRRRMRRRRSRDNGSRGATRSASSTAPTAPTTRGRTSTATSSTGTRGCGAWRSARSWRATRAATGLPSAVGDGAYVPHEVAGTEVHDAAIVRSAPPFARRRRAVRARAPR